MIKNALIVSSVIFLSWTNLKNYWTLQSNRKELISLYSEKTDLEKQISELNSQIHNLSVNVMQDLLETKAMWILGYSPMKSKILLH